MPQPFLDIAFPGSVGRGATGGPGFSTQIVTLASGAEQRNVNWSNSRGRWNISTGIRSRADDADQPLARPHWSARLDRARVQW
jgi:uncharacterized protein (TIGR02217 family)